MNRYKLLLNVLCVMMLLVLSACGDVASTATPVPAAPDTPTTTPQNTATTAPQDTPTTASESTAPQGEPIRLGSVVSCSGAQAASLGGICDALMAWEKYTNAHGGINGHPVKMIVVDDGLDPARSQAGVKRLVEEEKVQAIVGEYSLQDATWAEYIQEKGVPVVGGTATQPSFMSQPGFFSSGAQTPALLYALVNETKKLGKLKLGVMVCAEAPVCAGLPPIIERIAKDVIGGSSVVYSAKIAAAQPNYTAECLAAKEAGVDALYVAQNSVVVERVAEQCAQQGLKPLMLGTAGTLDRNAPNPNFEGALSGISNASVAVNSTPATKAFHEALETYAPALVGAPQYNNALVAAWVGGQLFAAAAEKGNIGPDSTPAEVKEALYALKDETLGGYSAPLNYVRDKPNFIPCYFVQRIENTKLTSPYGSEPVCIPEADVTKLMAALAP